LPAARNNAHQKKGQLGVLSENQTKKDYRSRSGGDLIAKSTRSESGKSNT